MNMEMLELILVVYSFILAVMSLVVAMVEGGIEYAYSFVILSALSLIVSRIIHGKVEKLQNSRRGFNNEQ